MQCMYAYTRRCVTTPCMPTGHEELFLRFDMDVHIVFRDPLQQVALGLFWFPLSHRTHGVAHVVLLYHRLPLRASL